MTSSADAGRRQRAPAAEAPDERRPAGATRETPRAVADRGDSAATGWIGQSRGLAGMRYTLERSMLAGEG